MPRRDGIERMYLELPTDEGLKESLKEMAVAHRRSLNQEVVEILVQAVNAYQQEKRKKKARV